MDPLAFSIFAQFAVKGVPTLGVMLWGSGLAHHSASLLQSGERFSITMRSKAASLSLFPLLHREKEGN